jgi:hypothetical protein
VLCRTFLVAVLTLAVVLAGTRPGAAYSVLGHEGMVDALWDREIVPLLRDRFTGLTVAQLSEARAYAYGGSLIQDLGYYPFGSHLLTNLTHYVRSGDFVECLIRTAATPNEYAFALGALAHYTSDNAGHPLAVNRVVPMMYPKVRAKVGPEALYADSPARHVMVEFAFDVLQVARGAYVDQAYRDRIGFEVAKPLLDRALHETYALSLEDLLLNVELAIGTYRRAVGTTIPELTRIAWRERREEIEKRTPGVLAFVLKILPKVGPLRPLAFEPLTPDADRLFGQSVTAARIRYRTALEAIRDRRLRLTNTDFDTGRPPVPGENRLTDETHADLLHKLAGRKFADVSPQLRAHLRSFFDAARARPSYSSKQHARIQRELQALDRAVTSRAD